MAYYTLSTALAYNLVLKHANKKYISITKRIQGFFKSTTLPAPWNLARGPALGNIDQAQDPNQSVGILYEFGHFDMTQHETPNREKY